MSVISIREELIWKDCPQLHDPFIKKILKARNHRSDLNFKLLLLAGCGMIILGGWLFNMEKERVLSHFIGQSITANHEGHG